MKRVFEMLRGRNTGVNYNESDFIHGLFSDYDEYIKVKTKKIHIATIKKETMKTNSKLSGLTGHMEYYFEFSTYNSFVRVFLDKHIFDEINKLNVDFK